MASVGAGVVSFVCGGVDVGMRADGWLSAGGRAARAGVGGRRLDLQATQGRRCEAVGFYGPGQWARHCGTCGVVGRAGGGGSPVLVMPHGGRACEKVVEGGERCTECVG